MLYYIPYVLPYNVWQFLFETIFLEILRFNVEKDIALLYSVFIEYIQSIRSRQIKVKYIKAFVSTFNVHFHYFQTTYFI